MYIYSINTYKYYKLIILISTSYYYNKPSTYRVEGSPGEILFIIYVNNKYFI